MSLKFTALSGTTGVTQNLYIYEYGGDLIIVDCGVGFPESEMYGVDLVIPDFSYILQNKDRLRGILITHGHEDHLGALPFLIRNGNAPIYSTKLVAGFIKDKFSEYKIKDFSLKVFDPEKDVLQLGVFKVTPFRISHSVPDSVGYIIDTPEGRVFHAADFKFDWTPVDGRPFDINKAASYSQNVLALASDCLGSTTPGYTESEKEIEGRIENIVRKAHGQVFFTTISSNISRIQQAMNVAAGLGRKVAFIGRSIEAKAEIAKNLGYLHYPADVMAYHKDLKKLPNDKRMYIISGSYGQSGSALYRLSLGEHEFLKSETGDTVIFSGDPAPPGSKDNVDFVVDRLIEQNLDVHYYDVQEDLHVSGHASQQDILMLASVVNPKYFMPIGGTVRHMRAYKDIMAKRGVPATRIFELGAGGVVEFEGGQAKLGKDIPTQEVLVDGLGIGDVGNVVLRDRQRLAQDGIAIILIEIDRLGEKLIAEPEIISRGFVFQGKMKNLLYDASRELGDEIRKKKKIDKRLVRNVAIDFLERFFYKTTGRRPMILPLIVDI